MSRRLKTLAREIVSAAMQIQGKIGPGIPESTHEACMMLELIKRGFQVERRRTDPLPSRGGSLPGLLVENELLVELQSGAAGGAGPHARRKRVRIRTHFNMEGKKEWLYPLGGFPEKR